MADTGLRRDQGARGKGLLQDKGEGSGFKDRTAQGRCGGGVEGQAMTKTETQTERWSDLQSWGLVGCRVGTVWA